MHNILTVFRSGGVYSDDYVRNLRRSVERHLKATHRFIVLTDTVDAAVVRDGVEYIPLENNWPGHYAKAEIFRPDLGERFGRLFYIDLSCLVVGDISDLANYSGPSCVGRDFQYDYPSQYMLNFAAGSLTKIWSEFKQNPEHWMRRGDAMQPPFFRDQVLMEIQRPRDLFQDKYPGQIVSFKKHCKPFVPQGARVIKFHGEPRIHNCGGWVQAIWKGGGQPQWESRINHDLSHVHANIEKNGAQNSRWLEPQPPHKRRLVIAGGGPSLSENAEKIKLRKRRGHTVWALNGAHDYLIANRVIPDAMVIIDSRPDNVEFVRKARRGVSYLLAANCDPALFDALTGHDVKLWFQDIDGARAIHDRLQAKFVDRKVYAIPGGNTVGLRALALGFWQGYRHFTLFGYDSSYRNGKNHAYRQPLNDGEVVELVYAGETPFHAARWMIVQTNVFQEMAKQLIEQFGCTIDVIGDGLLPYVAQQMVKNA